MRAELIVFVGVASCLLTWNLVQMFANRELMRELDQCRAQVHIGAAQLRVLSAATAATPSMADNSVLEERAVAMVRRERELERDKCAEVARQFASLRAESDVLSRRNMKLEREFRSSNNNNNNDGGGGGGGGDGCDDPALQTFAVSLAEENRALRDTIAHFVIGDHSRKNAVDSNL